MSCHPPLFWIHGACQLGLSISGKNSFIVIIVLQINIPSREDLVRPGNQHLCGPIRSFNKGLLSALGLESLGHNGNEEDTVDTSGLPERDAGQGLAGVTA